MTDAGNAERGYTITRVFDAPRQLVWNAFTQPEQWAQWFGEPGTTWEGLTMDVRPGGSWAGKMVGPGRAYEIPWRGKYLEVDEPQRLVLAVTDGEVLGAEFETLTITLTDLGAKTELVLRQSGHMTDDEYEHAKNGTSGFLDRMAELVAQR
jgi:uncharacterized protein YndB with AHSA1/START domain